MDTKNNQINQNIEVEIKSLITKEKYDELFKFFKKHGEFVNKDYQETFYFDSPVDLRIQKNDFFSKIVMKKGKVHDETREELEIRFEKDEFPKLEKLFLELGFKTQIKWFRTRNNFKWGDIDVALDYTKGYGYIIEIEKMAEKKDQEKVLAMLKEKIGTLNVLVTPREEFDKKFNNYKLNWEKLVSEDDG